VTKRVNGRPAKAGAAKRVTEQPHPETDRYLVWSFGRLDHGGRFSCRHLLSTDVRTLEVELATFQTELISELRRKRWLKFIGVEEMTPAGQERLAEVAQQENGLWQLHLGRYKWRIWGFFEHPKFFFLWWDGHHDVATGKARRRKS